MKKEHIIERDTMSTTEYRNISQYYNMEYILKTKVLHVQAYYMNNCHRENFHNTFHNNHVEKMSCILPCINANISK